MDKIKNKLCRVCSKKARIKCDQCGKVSYCSRECQFKDWNRHKGNCKYNTKTKLSKEKKDFKRKKTETNKYIDKEFNLSKANRRRRHFQTISIRPNNLSDLVEIKTNNKNTDEDLTPIKEEQNSIDKTKEDKIDFHFIEKFQNILFKKDNNNNNNKIKKNESEQSSYDNSFDEKNINYKNERIKKMYNLLIEHRNFLLEKILLNPNRTYYFTSIYVMFDAYYGIEKYIINYILLIKFLYFQKDPLSLIKADQALNVLGKELFNLNNSKKGLLVFSIQCIFKKFVEVLEKKNNFYQIIGSIQDVAKRFLSLISCINKLSHLLKDYKMYIKSLFYYNKYFELSLKFISNGKSTEKIILRSNLKFNIGCSFIKNKYLNTSIKIFKDIINFQKSLEPCSFICGVVYYNISIIYYIMDKIKESELYINEGFEKINKLLDLKKLSKQREDFRRLTRLLLLFYSELNLERENYPKAVQCLKAVIDIMIDDSQSMKIRHKTQLTKKDKPHLKLLKHMKFVLGNYIKDSNIRPDFKIKFEMESKNKGKSKNKINAKAPIDYLFEIQYFTNTPEKILFEENMKTMVNGLFDKINFYYNEKMKKEREKKNEVFYLRTEQKKKTDKYIDENRRKRVVNLIIKGDNLPDLNVKNIVKNNANYNLDFDLDEFTSRERNKTIAKVKRTNFLKEKLSEEKEKEKEENENNMKGNELKNISKETTNKIINYLNDKMIQRKKILDNEKDISDFKYFFLLLTSLSYRQIELLNKTQNLNMPLAMYKNLPILFSRQFKNSLNPSQRNMFNKLRVLSLIRCKVLREVNKPISINNINFGIFHTQLNFNDFKIKKYSNIIQLLKEMTQSKIKTRTPMKEGNHKKIITFSSLRRKSLRNSFYSKNEDNNRNSNLDDKTLKFDDSNENGEEEDEEDFNLGNDNDVEFKYKNKYDINILKDLLIEKINFYEKFPEEEKDLLIDIIKSGLFIQLMNSLELSKIIEFENDLDTMIEFLKIFENLKDNNDETFIFNSKDEEDKLKNYNKIESSSSGSNSVDLDIDEKQIVFNDIRRTFMLNTPKIQFDSFHKESPERKFRHFKRENTIMNSNFNNNNENKYKRRNTKYARSKTIMIKNDDNIIDGDDVINNNNLNENIDENNDK